MYIKDFPLLRTYGFKKWLKGKIIIAAKWD